MLINAFTGRNDLYDSIDQGTSIQDQLEELHVMDLEEPTIFDYDAKVESTRAKFATMSLLKSIPTSLSRMHSHMYKIDTLSSEYSDSGDVEEMKSTDT